MGRLFLGLLKGTVYVLLGALLTLFLLNFRFIFYDDGAFRMERKRYWSLKGTFHWNGPDGGAAAATPIRARRIPLPRPSSLEEHRNRDRSVPPDGPGMDDHAQGAVVTGHALPVRAREAPPPGIGDRVDDPARGVARTPPGGGTQAPGPGNRTPSPDPATTSDLPGHPDHGPGRTRVRTIRSRETAGAADPSGRVAPGRKPRRIASPPREPGAAGSRLVLAGRGQALVEAARLRTRNECLRIRERLATAVARFNRSHPTVRMARLDLFVLIEEGFMDELVVCPSGGGLMLVSGTAVRCTLHR